MNANKGINHQTYMKHVYLDTSIITVDIASIIAKNLAKCEIELLKVILPEPICVSPHIDLIYAAVDPLALCYKCNPGIHGLMNIKIDEFEGWSKNIIENDHIDCMQSYIRVINAMENKDKVKILSLLPHIAVEYNNGDMLYVIIKEIHDIIPKINNLYLSSIATSIIKRFKHNCYSLLVAEIWFRRLSFIRISINYRNLPFLELYLPRIKNQKHINKKTTTELAICIMNIIKDIIKPKYGPMCTSKYDRYRGSKINIDRVIDLNNSLSDDEIIQHEKYSFVSSVINLSVNIRLDELRIIVDATLSNIRGKLRYGRYVSAKRFFCGPEYTSSLLRHVMRD